MKSSVGTSTPLVRLRQRACTLPPNCRPCHCSWCLRPGSTATTGSKEEEDSQGKKSRTTSTRQRGEGAAATARRGGGSGVRATARGKRRTRRRQRGGARKATTDLAEEQARARFAGPTPGPGPSRVFYRILLQLVQEVRPSIFPVPDALQLTAAVSLNVRRPTDKGNCLVQLFPVAATSFYSCHFPSSAACRFALC